MEHTKELLSVPQTSLVPSRFNVRRHAIGQVEELSALFEAQGLLRNLVVTEQEAGRGKSRKPEFAVAAGERRRRAMLLLQQRGCLPKEHEVLCELVPPERALEVSLAQNIGREAMHPAGEFEALKAMIDEGKGVDDVAARVGVSVLTVQRQLKLKARMPMDPLFIRRPPLVDREIDERQRLTAERRRLGSFEPAQRFSGGARSWMLASADNPTARRARAGGLARDGPSRSGDLQR